MNNYKESKLWQKSVDPAAKISGATPSFPKEEMYELTSQANRCTVSVLSGIVEGAGRNAKEKGNSFLGISACSVGYSGYFITINSIHLD